MWMVWMKLGLLGLLLIFLQRSLVDAIGSIESTPPASNGSLTVCPGEIITFTCTYNNTNPNRATTRWILPGITQDCVLIHETTEVECDPFTVTMISNNTDPTLSSTVSTTSENIPSSSVVRCLGGTRLSSPEIGNITVDIYESQNPLIKQNVTFPFSIEVKNDSTLCATSYQVLASHNHNQEGSGESDNKTLSSPTLLVSVLNLCQYNYTIVNGSEFEATARNNTSSGDECNICVAFISEHCIEAVTDENFNSDGIASQDDGMDITTTTSATGDFQSQRSCNELCAAAIAMMITVLAIIIFFIGICLFRNSKNSVKLCTRVSSVKYEMKLHKSDNIDDAKSEHTSNVTGDNEENAISKYPVLDIAEPTYAVVDVQQAIIEKVAGNEKLTTTSSPYVEIVGHQHDTQMYAHVISQSQQTNQIVDDVLEVQYADLDYNKLVAKEDSTEIQNSIKEVLPVLPPKPAPLITETLYALLTPAADKWYELGLAMDFSEYTLKEDIYPGNSTNWLRLGEVCGLYCQHKHTWEEVVHILWKVEEWEIADKICRQEKLEVKHPLSQIDGAHPPSLPPRDMRNSSKSD